MTTCVVLGSNSFSGQDFIDLLIEVTDWKVIGISRSAEAPAYKLAYKRHRGLDKRFRFEALDMNRDMDRILDLLLTEEPDYIVNFAAQSEVAPSWEHPEQWFQTNTVALARLVNGLRDANWLKRYLHVSSPEAYGTCIGRVKEDAPDNPSTPYAASKAAADMLLSTYHKQFGFPLVTVRSTNVYGARQQLFKIIPRSIIFMKQSRTIELHGGGKAIKSYIHVRDVSAGELDILTKGEIGERYHLSPNGGVSIHDLVAAIADAMGADFEQATKVVDERRGQDAAYVIDSTKAREAFGWSPEIGLGRGLQECIDWVEHSWSDIEGAELAYIHKD